MTEKGLRDEPIVITIDLTNEFYDNWLRAARLTESAPKEDRGAAIKMKDLERDSP